MHVRNSVAIQGHRQVQHSVSGTATVSATLNQGTYDVWCDVDVFIRVAKSSAVSPDRAQDVTVVNGYKIAAGNSVPVDVPQDCIIGMIAGGAGTCSIHRVA